MKDYKQLLKELPSTTVVCAVGDFDPPTVAHELLVKTVNRLAESKGSAHVIFTSPSKTLQEDKKSQYLKLMFPKTNFTSIQESFTSSVEQLKKKYKNVIVVVGAEQSTGLKKALKESVEFVTINEKNPDADTSKMKSFATKALYEEFKKKLPSTIRELDGRRLMNDVRQGLGLEPIKEQLVLVKDKLREQYFRGEIFNEGDIVESNGELFTIIKRGSNHLLLKEQSGELVSKWIQDVKLIENHTLINHNKDHKEFTHGADFSMKVGKEHHGKIGDLEHGGQHEFKCMNGNEWTVERRHDKLHFTGHKQDTGISSNISFHIPHHHFVNEVEPESEDTKQIKSFSQMLMDKAEKTPEKITPQERTLINMISKTDFGKNEISEGVIQPNGTDKIDTKASTSDTGAKAESKPKGKTKGFMTFYNYNMKESHLSGAEPIHIATSASDEDKDSESDEDFLNQMAHEYDPREVGHTLVPGIPHKGSHHLRRMKTKYHIGEQTAPAGMVGTMHTGSQHLGRTPATDKFHDKEAKAKIKATLMLKQAKEKETLSHKHEAEKEALHNEELQNEARMSAAVRLQRAFEREKQKSEASRRRGQELLNPSKPNQDTSRSGNLNAVGAENTKSFGEETEEQKEDRKKQLKRFKDQVTEKEVCPKCGKNPCECGEEKPGMGTEYNQYNDPFFKEDFTEEEIDEMVNSVTEQDIEDLYEEDEIVLVYDDTGEEIPPLQEESKYDLMEVLSRTERMRGKIRLRKTAAKRGRSTKIALKRFSPPATINKRARRLAIKLMKKRMLRGRDYSKVSVGEKERIEKAMAKNKNVISRIAQKLVSRVRKTEKTRMSHGKVTKGNMPSIF